MKEKSKEKKKRKKKKQKKNNNNNKKTWQTAPAAVPYGSVINIVSYPPLPEFRFL